MIKRILFALFITTGFFAIAQPYVVNEKLNKVFSEAFSDVNKNFPITESSNPNFWATYGDGYYYIERKQKSPRAVVANFDGTSQDFCIKSKLNLGPTRSNSSSVGIMFLVQPGGRGGFVFELNRKKSFRITDLGTGAYITKDGDDGWIKNKNISPATRYSTVEIKAFRGKFDIYVNDVYVHSFVNKVYQKGKCGLYIGPESTAKVMYYNVYELTVPGAPKKVDVKSLQEEIDYLRKVNDSLRTETLGKKYGSSNTAAIEAIKILEDQIKAVRDENNHLKEILENYESNEPVTTSEEEVEKIEINSSKIEALANERDSILSLYQNSNNELLKVMQSYDSLLSVNKDLTSKNEILNNHIEEIQSEIEKINNTKTPSAPSSEPTSPEKTTPTLPASGNSSSSKEEEKTETAAEQEEVKIVPLKKQKIKVKKATKTK